MENLTNELDNKKITVGMFIDLKKAFDTIYHSLLIKKLEYYGIRGVPLNWLKSYLDHRKQYVHFNGRDSYLQEVVCGVLQGSILGPKLFILYKNDNAILQIYLNSYFLQMTLIAFVLGLI